MLTNARTLMNRPKLLVLDEPSLGLAAKIIQEIFAIIVSLRKAGITILLVEQMANMCWRLPTVPMCLKQGGQP